MFAAHKIVIAFCLIKFTIVLLYLSHNAQVPKKNIQRLVNQLETAKVEIAQLSKAEPQPQKVH